MSNSFTTIGVVLLAIVAGPWILNGGIGHTLLDSAPVNGAIKNRPGISKKEMTLIDRESIGPSKTGGGGIKSFSDVAGQIDNRTSREKRLGNDLNIAQAEQFLCAASNEKSMQMMMSTPRGGEEWFELSKASVVGQDEAKSQLKAKASTL